MASRKAKTALMDTPILEVDVAINAWRAAQFLDGAFATVFAQHGITNPQYNVLRILYVRDDEHGMPCSEISQRLIHRVPDVTRLLDRLLRDGLIERHRCPLDRRVVRSRLTEKGQALVEALHPQLMTTHREVVASLTREEQEQLRDLLLKLVSR